jgi:hypothetical protein
MLEAPDKRTRSERGCVRENQTMSENDHSRLSREAHESITRAREFNAPIDAGVASMRHIARIAQQQATELATRKRPITVPSERHLLAIDTIAEPIDDYEMVLAEKEQTWWRFNRALKQFIRLDAVL